MINKYLNIVAGTLLIAIVIFVVFSFDSENAKTQKLHSKFNDIRVNEISLIDNGIQEFKNKKGSFPIAKNFTELIKIIGTYNNDFRYHYSYEGDGKYYILTYPQDSTEGVKCIVKTYSYSGAVDKNIIDRNCESTITKR